MWSIAAILVPLAAAHVLLPWYTRRGIRENERDARLPGDDIVRSLDADVLSDGRHGAIRVDAWGFH